MGNHWNLILWSYPFQKGRTNVDLAKKYYRLQLQVILILFSTNRICGQLGFQLLPLNWLAKKSQAISICSPWDCTLSIWMVPDVIHLGLVLGGRTKLGKYQRTFESARTTWQDTKRIGISVKDTKLIPVFIRKLIFSLFRIFFDDGLWKFCWFSPCLMCAPHTAMLCVDGVGSISAVLWKRAGVFSGKQISTEMFSKIVQCFVSTFVSFISIL